MKTFTLSTWKIVLGYAALIYTIAILLTSCSSSRYFPRIKNGGPCQENRGFVGYSK